MMMTITLIISVPTAATVGRTHTLAATLLKFTHTHIHTHTPGGESGVCVCVCILVQVVVVVVGVQPKQPRTRRRRGSNSTRHIRRAVSITTALSPPTQTRRSSVAVVIIVNDTLRARYFIVFYIRIFIFFYNPN